MLIDVALGEVAACYGTKPRNRRGRPDPIAHVGSQQLGMLLVTETNLDIRALELKSLFLKDSTDSHFKYWCKSACSHTAEVGGS